MGSFEKFIKDNKEEFESSPLPMGHEARFLQRLVDFRQNSISSKSPRNWLLYVSAIVILLLSIPAALYFMGHDERSFVNPEVYMTEEQQEAQVYYVASIESGCSTLEHMLTSKDLAEPEKHVIEDVVANFESRRIEILEDLNASSGDEKVIDALLDYYRIKLEVIDGIVHKLESLNKDEYETEQNIEL